MQYQNLQNRLNLTFINNDFQNYSLIDYFSQKSESRHLNITNSDIIYLLLKIDGNPIGITGYYKQYSDWFLNLSNVKKCFEGAYLCSSYINPKYRNLGLYSYTKDIMLTIAQNFSSTFQSITGQKKHDRFINMDLLLNNIDTNSRSSYYWCINRGFTIIGYSRIHGGPLMQKKDVALPVLDEYQKQIVQNFRKNNLIDNL